MSLDLVILLSKHYIYTDEMYPFIRQNERVEIPSIGGDAEIICNGESKIDDARAKLYLSHDGSNIPQDRNETQFELFSTHLKI